MAIYSYSRPDILVQSPNGLPIAVVEIKNIMNLSRDIATEMRHNIVARGVPSQVPYFLLVSQDVGFLWKGQREGLDVPPDYMFPMSTIVTRYLKRKSDERIYREVFELLVLQWLSDLAAGRSTASDEPEKTLALAGFYDDIKGATVLAEAEL